MITKCDIYNCSVSKFAISQSVASFVYCSGFLCYQNTDVILLKYWLNLVRLIPNHTFLVRFDGISGEIDLAMGILAACVSPKHDLA